jgi:hypothetical protein
MDTYNSDIIWRFKALAFSMCRHDFMRHGIVSPMIPVLHVLVSKFIVGGKFVAVWAFISTFALSFGEEGTNMWTIAFIVWISTGQLF